jgi:UDPglucose 6-dehydrogenase
MKPLVKKIVCIGAGYVGGPTMAVIADRCPDLDVTVLDLNEARIAAWNSEELPIYEPGLAAVVSRARGRNLRFVGQIEGAAHVAAADAVFISVNTPTKTDGEGAGKASDLRYVESCARFIAAHATGHTIVIEKSTMPVRAADRIKSILASAGPGVTFDILSNPEFLAEGTAIRDLEQPDRVLIGGERPEPIAALASVYARWVPAERIITTGLWSAELAKLAANAFLAQRVSSINALSALCEVTGADVDEVAQVVGSDSRIGSKFLKASVGFGGSCFKKDILSLVYLCEFHGIPEAAAYWQQVIDLNEWQKRRFADLVIRQLGAAKGKVAVLGLAFKKDTNDFRESAALHICGQLLAAGLEVTTYDPQVDFAAFCQAAGIAQGMRPARTIQEALSGASAVAVLTEWEEFRCIDWATNSPMMPPQAIIYDGRNVIDAQECSRNGLRVRTIGKPDAIFHK